MTPKTYDYPVMSQAFAALLVLIAFCAGLLVGHDIGLDVCRGLFK